MERSTHSPLVQRLVALSLALGIITVAGIPFYLFYSFVSSFQHPGGAIW